jgi:hypothetical protein
VASALQLLVEKQVRVRVEAGLHWVCATAQCRVGAYVLLQACAAADREAALELQHIVLISHDTDGRIDHRYQCNDLSTLCLRRAGTADRKVRARGTRFSLSSFVNRPTLQCKAYVVLSGAKRYA